MKNRITDRVWSAKQRLVMDNALSYQWSIINGDIIMPDYSSVLQNLQKVIDGVKENYKGFVFQDSDAYKWLESAAYALQLEANDKLKKQCDKFVELLALAQATTSDGYINTYFMINHCDRKYTDLQNSHELYCAGHFFEAAVALYNSYGSKQALQVATKWADGLVDRFLNDNNNGYDGHQEIELALVKLYEVTNKKEYLQLASKFLTTRGTEPNFIRQEHIAREGAGFFNGWKKGEGVLTDTQLEHYQAHKPFLEQREAVGHSVRLVYMITGAFKVAKHIKDNELLIAANALYNDITNKKMYVTGGIGSAAYGEGFSTQYDLPIETGYLETCAAIGLSMAAKAKQEIVPCSKNADIIELCLYNSIISGVSLDGKKYFYNNPLMSTPNIVNPTIGYKSIKRQDWYSCACCPPNITRFLLNLSNYVYTITQDCVYWDLFIGGEYCFKDCTVIVKADYPNSKIVEFKFKGNLNKKFAIRVPNYTNNERIDIIKNGKKIDCKQQSNGYLVIEVNDNDELQYTIPLTPRFVYTNSSVNANKNKVAVAYGPTIYAMEQVDNQEIDLFGLCVDDNTQLTLAEQQLPILGDIATINIKAKEIKYANQELYFDNPQLKSRPVNIKMIPYYLWANREVGNMNIFFDIRK